MQKAGFKVAFVKEPDDFHSHLPLTATYSIAGKEETALARAKEV
jgi:hypothetical protein